MTIKTRVNAPESKGRHPLLKPGSIHNRFYNFIKKNPGCTRQTVKDGTNTTITQVSKRVAELKNQGLITEGEKVLCPVTHRKVSTLYTNVDNMTGDPRRKISVVIRLYENKHGGYHTEIDGQSSSADLHLMKYLGKKRVTYEIAKPGENLQTSATGNLTIDADYVTIDQ